MKVAVSFLVPASHPARWCRLRAALRLLPCLALCFMSESQASESPAAPAPAELIIDPPDPQVVAGQTLRFLVTRRTPDGWEEDVTQQAVTEIDSPEKLRMTSPGSLDGLQDGPAKVVFGVGDLRVETQVRILPRSDQPPSFVQDVLPVLGRAGCNAGACHAKADGQNGFQLTVFSFDPQADYRNITDGARGRRVFPADPRESLLLLKATGTVPHEGGERILKGSQEWHTLARWIGAGMVYQNPQEPSIASLQVFPASRRYRAGSRQSLLVQAHFTDGSIRDVSALAQFESNDKSLATVSPQGQISIGSMGGQGVVVARYMGMVGDSRILVPVQEVLNPEQYQTLPVHNFIDRLAWPQLQQAGVFPSERCTDGEFLRRASLDLLGKLPTAREAREFLESPDPDKRSKAVDRLLEDPAWADFTAIRWADLLRPNPDRVGVKGVFLLDQWLRSVFRENRTYDRWIREILLTKGNTHRLGPAVIYRDRREPADLGTLFSQVFLGTRLDCARCHHHPNEKWSQEDFYRFAAYFAPLQQKGGGISAPISGGNETFFTVAGRSVKHPVSGEVLTPRPPDGPPAEVGTTADPRESLAEWMTGASQKQMARAISNRIWSWCFGKGLVDPVDDFRLTNPPSHPALLEALADEFIRLGYDGKALVRIILQSHLYQLSHLPNATNLQDQRLFSRSLRRRLGAEVMADAVSDLTGVPGEYPGLPPGSRAVQAWTYKIDSRTMDAFGRPNSSSDCPCERNLKPSISQALHLMNAEDLQNKLSSTSPASQIQQLSTGSRPVEEIVDELYLACYTRYPTSEERALTAGYFPANPEARRAAIEDLLWSLINSAEFVFNH